MATISSLYLKVSKLIVSKEPEGVNLKTWSSEEAFTGITRSNNVDSKSVLETTSCDCGPMTNDEPSLFVRYEWESTRLINGFEAKLAVFN
ncbi:hypothetical protein WICPIJ_002611 [Wickerhamomyces pijperi]|uniref:Uncharacterized protein n=1 Tax=Wickerhamomyces pijperi TaxID=599730 RepID=A0A9P8Q8P2_WICPI|nr:hypothetical protein WICPIJ_002611 [Wickerhamomyces pijperi]